MAYPITCYAGFPMPLSIGKYEITGIAATVDDPTAASYVILYDDSSIKASDLFGKMVLFEDLDETKYQFIYLKGLANVDTLLSYEWAEPLKTRYGLSVCCNNIRGGSLAVYRR